MGKVNLGKVRGNMWYAGTAISGTSISGAIFIESGISRAYENDLYLNTRNGNVYQCGLGGESDTAQWIYVGSIKGPMPEVVNGLNSTSKTRALSANAGRILNEKIVNAGLYAQCIIIDCSEAVYTVKLLIENKDTEIHLTDMEGKSVDYSYKKEGEGQEKEIFITAGGRNINEVQSTSASIMNCQLFDVDGEVIYEITPSLWDAVNELKRDTVESTSITESSEKGNDTVTYRTSIFSKVIDGIRTIMFPVTQAKAVWWNKLENRTVFEKIESDCIQVTDEIKEDDIDKIIGYKGAMSQAAAETTKEEIDAIVNGLFS